MEKRERLYAFGTEADSPRKRVAVEVLKPYVDDTGRKRLPGNMHLELAGTVRKLVAEGTVRVLGRF